MHCSVLSPAPHETRRKGREVESAVPNPLPACPADAPLAAADAALQFRHNRPGSFAAPRHPPLQPARGWAAREETQLGRGESGETVARRGRGRGGQLGVTPVALIQTFHKNCTLELALLSGAGRGCPKRWAPGGQGQSRGALPLLGWGPALGAGALPSL